MRELTFVGMSDDGARVLLADDAGTSYTVMLDDRLAAALRRERPRSGRQETPVEPLRPKDVQARIRGGATAEEVAEESGWALDHVRRYEGPPLAERAWFAQQAREVEIRRPEGPTPLEELVAHRLEERGISRDSLRWDSWKRDDGRWTVLLAYPAEQGERVATWTFDPAGRSLHTADDEARWLVEEPSPAPEPEPEPARSDRPRLVGLPSVPDDGRHDTIPVMRPLPPDLVVAEVAVAEVAVDVTAVEVTVVAEAVDSAVATPEAGAPASAEVVESAGAAASLESTDDEPLEPVAELPSAWSGTATQIVERPAAKADLATEPVAAAGATDATEDAGPAAGAEGPPAATPGTPRPRRSRAKRASVPSWDEILFGAAQRDE